MSARTLICPVCAAASPQRVLERDALPVNCVQLWPTRAEALAIPRAAMRLESCSHCGYIWNSAFESERVVYTPEYDASLHFSPRFQRDLEELVTRLTSELDLRGKLMLEIGCGKGEFLDLMCRRGAAKGIGFDTSFSGVIPDDATWTVEERVFRAEEREASADLVCSRHVLEHVVDPLSFLRAMRAAVASSRSGAVYLEVPNGLWVVRDLGIWDVIYEHVSLFTPLCLDGLLRRAGLKPLWLETAFDGQYLRALAVPCEAEEVPLDAAALAQQQALLARFASTFREKIATWDQRLQELAAQQQTAALWGAGAKGSTFLSCVRALDVVQHVIDINPRKVGRYVPGTGHCVEGPEALREQPVDQVLVMNPSYAAEIRVQLQAMGLSPQIACV